MNIETMVEVLGKYGIGGLMMIVLCFISYLIIKHILKQSDKILDSAMTAQKEWQRAIDEHTAQAKSFHDQVTEAHRYQKQEHEKMIENLGEQAKVLARINGYK